MVKIYKFYLDKNNELSPESVGKAIRLFRANVLPELKHLRDYYDGKQAITLRAIGDASRPNNRIVKNYCATIVDNFQGYLTGAPITYSAGGVADNIEGIQVVLDSNDVINEDSDFLRDALIYGIAFEMAYVNEDKQARFKRVSPENTIPIFSDDMDNELLYMITFSPCNDWLEDSEGAYRVGIYTDKEYFTYRASNDFNSFELLDSGEHYFGMVPFAIFNLNSDNKSIFERIITLQDAYNALLSDEVNDFEAFVDAYMVMKNITADAYDLAAMKQNRTILIDGESDVSYLTKNISDTQIENMLSNLNTSIHTISNSPDFSSEEFNAGVSSGIALQFKLVGFNNIASNIQAQMTKALHKRIELNNSILKLIDTDTADVDITFTHNLPTAVQDTVQMVNGLRGLVSDETLLAQIPFIDDVRLEQERIDKENDSKASMFDNHPAFGVMGDEEEQE